jgi:hypothetical protein
MDNASLIATPLLKRATRFRPYSHVVQHLHQLSCRQYSRAYQAKTGEVT